MRRSIVCAALALTLAIVPTAQGQQVTITAGAQVPAGFLFVGESAAWRLNIMIEPPKFTREENIYEFSSLDFPVKEIAPAVAGENVSLTLPTPTSDQTKIVYRGAILSTSALKSGGRKTVRLKARAVYKAAGKPDIPIESQLLALTLDVGKLELVDTTNNNAVLMGVKKTIVGKKIGLKGRVNPDPGNAAVITARLWTVPGNVVKNYTQTEDKAEVALLKDEDLKQDAISYYWINGLPAGTPVNYKITANGRVISASAKFDVHRPVPTFVTRPTTSAPATKGVDVGDAGFMDPDPSLHFGVRTSPGIGWIGSVRNESDFAGTIGSTQVVSTVVKVTLDDFFSTKKIKTSDGKSVLDSDIIALGMTAPAPANSPSARIAVPDTPQEPLVRAEKFVSRSDEFLVFLMFKPEGGDSIWVSMSFLPWKWKGSAVKQNGAWSLGNNPGPDASNTELRGTDTIALPIWEKNVKTLQFVNDN